MAYAFGVTGRSRLLETALWLPVGHAPIAFKFLSACGM